jgi:hypothetical protein
MTNGTSPPLQKYLSEPVDYSPTFTARVAELAALVRQSTGLPVIHNASMDYSAAQKLVLVPQGSTTCQVRVHISSRGPLFAVVYYSSQRGSWHQNAPSAATEECRKLVECATSVLRKRGLLEIPAADWSTPAPGKMTDMDGIPATVFDVLFSELP